MSTIPSWALSLIDEVLKVEGGYSNDPNDRGGETNYGITLSTLRDYGLKIPIASLTKDQARQIYYKKYILTPSLDTISSLSIPIVSELFDTGVNTGPVTSIKILQRSLNLFNRRGSDYPDLKVDGVLSSSTKFALSSYLSKRGSDGEKCLLSVLNSLQSYHYISLVEKDPSQEVFFYGWIKNRVVS